MLGLLLYAALADPDTFLKHNYLAVDCMTIPLLLTLGLCDSADNQIACQKYACTNSLETPIQRVQHNTAVNSLDPPSPESN